MGQYTSTQDTPAMANGQESPGPGSELGADQESALLSSHSNHSSRHRRRKSHSCRTDESKPKPTLDDNLVLVPQQTSVIAPSQSSSHGSGRRRKKCTKHQREKEERQNNAGGSELLGETTTGRSMKESEEVDISKNISRTHSKLPSSFGKRPSATAEHAFPVNLRGALVDDTGSKEFAFPISLQGSMKRVGTEQQVLHGPKGVNASTTECLKATPVSNFPSEEWLVPEPLGSTSDQSHADAKSKQARLSLQDEILPKAPQTEGLPTNGDTSPKPSYLPSPSPTASLVKIGLAKTTGGNSKSKAPLASEKHESAPQSETSSRERREKARDPPKECVLSSLKSEITVSLEESLSSTEPLTSESSMKLTSADEPNDPLLRNFPSPRCSSTGRREVGRDESPARGFREPLGYESTPPKGLRISLPSPARLLGSKSQTLKWPVGYAPGVLYAREPERDSSVCQMLGGELVPTQLVKISVEADDRDLVFTDSAFDVRVVGLCVQEETSGGRAKFRNTLGPPKHRVLYSTRREGHEGSHSVIPAVHYDFRRESLNNLGRKYVPIASDRSLVTRSCGSPQLSEVSFKFALIQLQEDLQKDQMGRFSIVRSTLEKTLDQVDSFNAKLSCLGSSDVPYFSLLAPFIRTSGALGNSALEQAGIQERVIDTDLTFRLASRSADENPKGEIYLRFGYYFILSEPTTSRLYTQVDAVENIRLWTKQKNGGSTSQYPQSYVILRVSEQRLPVIEPSFTPLDLGSPNGKIGRNMWPPFEVRDVEVLRQALNDARDAPAAEFKARIMGLLDILGGGNLSCF